MLPASLAASAPAAFEDLYLQQTSLSQDSEKLAEAYLAVSSTGNTAMMQDIQDKAAPINQELVEVNKKIRSLWATIDDAVAYYQKNGRPMQDEGTSSTADDEPISDADASSTPTLTKASIDAIEDPAEQYRYKTARIESNKKYLRRTDMNDTPEWRTQVRLRAQELVDWEVKLSKRIRENLEKAEIHDL